MAAKTTAKKKAPAAESGSQDFAGAFAELRRMLQKYAPALLVKRDDGTGYTLLTSKGTEKKAIWFAMTEVKKSYVSFHLMPLYTHPQLGSGLSAELEKRRQGKTCFNFTKPDAAAFKELEAMTKEALAVYQREGLA